MEVSAGFVYHSIMEYRKQAHAVCCSQYHIVISTKCRRKVLRGMGECLKNSVQQIGRFHPEIEILEVNADLDHVHLLMSIPQNSPSVKW